MERLKNRNTDRPMSGETEGRSVSPSFSLSLHSSDGQSFDLSLSIPRSLHLSDGQSRHPSVFSSADVARAADVRCRRMSLPDGPPLGFEPGRNVFARVQPASARAGAECAAGRHLGSTLSEEGALATRQR